MSTTQAGLEALADDPRYRQLVRRRSRLGWTLTGVMLVAYLGFILLVAFDKAWLARPIADGAISLGIPVGLGVILLAIGLTGFYVRRANRVFDREADALVREWRG